MRVVIGTTALKHNGIFLREPSDYDYFDDQCLDGSDGHLIPTNLIKIIPQVDGYATNDAVYTLKCSHFGWDVNWTKTKSDVLVLKKLGCRLNEHLYDGFVKYWQAIHGDKSLLNMRKKKVDFFNNKATYVYDHDWLHELVAYPNKPLYTVCLKDGEDVLIDKDKFDTLPFVMRVKMFREEIAVIAVERWLVNPTNKGKLTSLEAWGKALHKTITTLTKGWATDFLVKNIEYFVNPTEESWGIALNKLNLEEDMEDIKSEIIRGLDVESWEDFLKSIAGVQKGETLYWEYCDNPQGVTDAAERNDFSILTQDGGGEGGSQYCHSVFSWRGKTYKVDYSYYSYNGYDIDYSTFREVKPVEKTVTVYE